MLSKFFAPLACLGLVIGLAFSATDAKKPRILFFSKSSGFEHSVISWKNGQPSHAEKVLQTGRGSGCEHSAPRFR